MRDSCGKSESKGRPRRRKGAEEAPGPPAESECLEWKLTVKLSTAETRLKKTVFFYKAFNIIPFQLDIFSL